MSLVSKIWGILFLFSLGVLVFCMCVPSGHLELLRPIKISDLGFM